MSRLDQAFIKAYQKQSRQSVRTMQIDMPTANRAAAAPAASRIAPPHAYFPPRHGAAAEPVRPAVTAPPPPMVAAPAPMAPLGSEAWSGLRAGSGRLTAAFEVERFEWPQQVDRLIERAGESLSRYAESLIEAGPNRPRCVLITGCRRGEGRTTLAMALARVLALRLGQVALVEADFGRPQLAERLSLVPQAGWQDLLSGQQPLAEALVESIAEPVTLLPATSLPFGARTPRIETRAAAVIETLAQQYSLVCIDSGPWLGASGDRRMSIAQCRGPIDAALVVRDMRHTSLEDCAVVGRGLSRLGISRWDIVETFVRD